ncbi:MAG: NAD-dependent epimerase/dehydratase family protein [Elainellaceae cyanobacterium]
MVTVVVTGVAGFIGSHLAQALLEQGHSVIGVDQFNAYYNPQLKRQNVLDLEKASSFKLIESDIQALNWPELLADVDVVYHQAAQAGVRSSWGEGFRNYTEQNINATQILLEAAKSARLQQFVYASSSSIYGNAATLPTQETICPQPVSPYGITKLAGEQLCQLYHQNFQVPTVALRYFTVYGPRQRPDMAFHKFFKAALTDQPITIYGDGQQTRDYTFIEDAIAANLAAGQVADAAGQVFNIGGGSRVGLMEVIDTMEAVSGRTIKREHIEQARGDARHTAADITKAQQILGYQPKVSLREGLAAEWNWIQGLYN